MDVEKAQSRRPKPRAPLADLGDAPSRANTANNTQTTPSRRGPDPTSRPTPSRGGPLTSHGAKQTKSNTLAEERPTTAVTSTDQADSKRFSAISATSTSTSKGPRRKSHIGPWQLGKTIGKGGCSRVRAVRHVYTGQYGAAKIISKSFAETARAQSLANLIKSAESDPALLADGKLIPFGLEREIVIMKLLEHRNIVRLYDVWENHNELYLIMEYVQGGELFHYIEEKRGLEEIEVVYLFRQVIAALIYCHRINIHHRDLKPENILLDRTTLQIKLVDFGMAALQPQGKFLSTPCGSPHYAAPEVVSLKPYDGSKADVWSCGVILYVMLVGAPPFNYSGDTRDIRKLWKLIETANYYLPPELSDEAKDLIRRILVPQPSRRINIESIWHHPFLHKYDESFGYNAENSKLEHWIGPHPRIEDWLPLDRHTIDREILRNLRTLWHSDSEATLIEKLLNDELNQEKYFYSALQKFRDEHLENLYVTPGGVGYSSSDHHHVRRPDPQSLTPLSEKSRTKSQYSILNDEHLHSNHGLCKLPSATGSYDPFRASREPSVNTKTNYVNVTIHRDGSRGRHSKHSRGPSISRGPGSLRVETLRKSSRRSSAISHRSLSVKGSPAQRQASVRTRQVSKVSVTSSVWPSSPPVIIRPNNTHKRGVSFHHLRKGSVTSATSPPPDSPSLPDSRVQTPSIQRPKRKPVLSSDDYSPTPQPQQVRSRKSGTVVPSAIRNGNPTTPNRYITKEVRKVSTELERVCEEAFFRSSAGSSTRTDATDKVQPYETPPSTISNHASGKGVGSAKRPAASLNPAELRDRPLPALPVDTPRTYIAKELAEAKHTIAARYTEEGGENIASFHEVFSHLNRLLQPQSQSVNDGKRTTSAPEPRSSALLSDLPIISEEDKIQEQRSVPAGREGISHGKRAVTEPGKKPWRVENDWVQQSTVRRVNPSSPLPVLPLNIIKQSDGGDSLNGTEPPKTPSDKVDSWGERRQNPAEFITTPQPQFDDTPQRGGADGAKKKSWFKRMIPDRHARDEVAADSTNQQERKRLTKIKEPVAGTNDSTKRNSVPKTPESSSTEFPIRDAAAGPSSRGGFLKMFRKRNDQKGTGLRIDTSEDYSDMTSMISAPFALSPQHQPGTASDTALDSGSPVETQQNWLARFLHIKPATKTLCFQVGRGLARQEIVRLLREWKCFGVKDVSFDRKTNVILARVDKNNHLKIRPVHFIAELYVVLEHGRRANLSVARFTQTRGAASSFRKVVDALETRLASKGLLVEDEGRRKEISEVVG